jgi:hypothetical protein
MTQLDRAWLRVNDAAQGILVQERFLTSKDARGIVSEILLRERGECPATGAVDLLAAHLKKMVARGRPPAFR